MNFKEVVSVFEQLEAESSRLIMTELLADLFKKASPHEAAIIANLSLGMLRPPYRGTRFNFAQKNIMNVLADLGDTSKDTITQTVQELGDLGSVAQEVSRARPHHHLTVLQMYERLEKIEQISGTGSQADKSERVLTLLKEITPVEAKYVVRIILDELRLGFSDMTIVDALSWMETGTKKLRAVIEEAYNLCADIGFIVLALKSEGINSLKNMKVHVGIPIRLAAAERMASPEAIFEKLGRCIAQPKLDGLRLQVHVNNKQKGKQHITIFSRNLLDVTHMFPELVTALQQVPVDDMICDGEAIVFDPNTGSYLPFQETAKRKRKHGVNEVMNEMPVQLNFFDILYLNGEELIHKPHNERYDILKKVVTASHSANLRLIPEIEITNAQQLESFFLTSIDAALEGIMVKKPNAPYQAGKRNFNWIKLKRIETGTLEDTIDCVILGYNKGSGKRAYLGLGAFLAGVFNKRKDCFQTLAKVGTGLTDEAIKDLKKRCDKIAVKEKPKNVECSKELYPDVWVSPEIVCSIRADEITLSPLHTAGKTAEHLGFALRFPRFMDYRPDKRPEQATDIEELKQLFKDQKVRKQ